MTTTPDPTTVREIAWEAMQQTARKLPYYPQGVTDAMAARGIDGRDMARYAAYGNAVREYIRTATVAVSWPNEQPQEFECEVCTKPITSYPCVLCEHEPDPWKKPIEQPQDTALLTPAELAELTASIEHLSGPDAWDEDRLEPALIPVTHYVPRLLAMVAKGPLSDEFGVRIDHLSTLREEYAVGTLADAQDERDRIAGRPDVVSCTVIGWLAGEWHEIGDGRG